MSERWSLHPSFAANAVSCLVRNLDQMEKFEEGKQLGDMIQPGYRVIRRETTQKKTARKQEFKTRSRNWSDIVHMNVIYFRTKLLLLYVASVCFFRMYF